MYEIFRELCDEKGVTPYRVGKDTGISRSIFSDWKNGRSVPKADKLKKIADYFGVPVTVFIDNQVQTFGQDEGYYLDDDVKELANFLHENPEYKVLFDATRKVKKDDIGFIRDMIERMS